MTRLASGGLVDRSRRLAVTFDGAPLVAHPGDTLASALVANGVRLVGRSFKYHRPRGIVAAGVEEPNALVTLGAGARRTPNLRATEVEVHDGLVAVSQNRWPSLRRDAMAVNDLLSPFLSAGFYYKTFMWPPAFWERLYEPMIRAAAGLGALSGERDPDASEKAFAFADLLVIGAGPAGLMAALVAGRAGARVILADEDFRLGGRLNAERMEVDGRPGAAWAGEVVTELAGLPNVRLMPRTSVIGAYDGGTWGAVERVSRHLAEPPADAPLDAFWRIAARRAILATGAIERPIAFPDNDRPGVMMGGAVRAYLNRWAAAPGRRAVVFTNNDDGWRTAEALVAVGIEVAALVDARPGATPPAGPWLAAAGAVVTGTRGRRGLRAVRLRDAAGERWVEADLLAVSGGWNPSVHLACHLGARPVWDEGVAAFGPPADGVPGLLAAGAAAGAFSTRAALAGGAAAAAEALAALGLAAGTVDIPEAEDGPVAVTAFWHVADAGGRAWVDLQNDVTVKDVALAAREGFRAAEHMKRYTTHGMATDQGKLGGLLGTAVLAGLTGRSVAETGITTFRPPWTPVPIAALGAGGQGQGFAPERLSPAHTAIIARGAPQTEAGLWRRPLCFPRPGEATVRAACDREVRMVRSTVGVCDVSTLGKIDVQGPDAAAFLDRVYANTISTLAPGRVRYGLMLREDGFAMDDGTVARLGPAHFLVTTTTAAAGEVLAHLDFAYQCLWPELDVAFASVTDHWAQVAVAGPLAREVVNAVIDAPVGSDGFPFMACGPVSAAGVAGRLFRISFSGEHAYELAVPARHGAALFDRLVTEAEARGGGAYGLEALNVLRIEKGHPTHAELQGRTTADDLGLGRLVAAGKDCIGRGAAARPGLSDPQREQLVGLKAIEAGGRLVAGAHVVLPGGHTTPPNDLGYLTSACFSPTLGREIALGFVRNGRARTGETVRVVCLLRGHDTPAEIVAPAFVDPEGERLRG
ncbi:sarcosine oxidase subunit alpha family protein [Amaricoccus sp.]|uniref:sarcosine oxidase subunit alpha family protein n=1 Tax=Amaricoccus sp. TaxID=1872485 RepID=UPI001B4783A8|nr:sarcosine oxidase subunit alpha family protein [Amaricoccus sp.]MBP7241172.1 sarcosine oxidase subunit alpha family protein [Amaricoccus sp.]